MKEEVVELLDENAKKTGQSMLKSQAHKQSLRHGGAHLWIYNSKGEVLLQLRHPAKDIRPNVWDVSVAGHITGNDTPEQTLEREAQEEMGIKVNPKDFKFIGIKKVDESMPDGSVHRVFNWTYIAKIDMEITDLKYEDGEVADARWLAINIFEKDLNDPKKLKKYTPPIQELYDEIIRAIRSDETS
jgi:isopentenyl-diphosphate delta-isomerase